MVHININSISPDCYSPRTDICAVDIDISKMTGQKVALYQVN